MVDHIYRKPKELAGSSDMEKEGEGEGEGKSVLHEDQCLWGSYVVTELCLGLSSGNREEERAQSRSKSFGREGEKRDEAEGGAGESGER